MYKNCSFTGHRTIPQAQLEQIRAAVARQIDSAYLCGCRSFFCGGAVGFDTLAAQEVIKYRNLHADVRLCLLLPCINQDRHWSKEQRSEYSKIISLADSVEYTSHYYSDECMKIRNMRLAECADLVVAYVNRWQSGAAQTVRMAQRMGKDVVNLCTGAL